MKKLLAAALFFAIFILVSPNGMVRPNNKNELDRIDDGFTNDKHREELLEELLLIEKRIEEIVEREELRRERETGQYPQYDYLFISEESKELTYMDEREKWYCEYILSNTVREEHQNYGEVEMPLNAITIADKVWRDMYGEAIYRYQPFVVRYYEEKDIWYVGGTLPPYIQGGTPVLIIQSSGEILLITHTE